MIPPKDYHKDHLNSSEWFGAIIRYLLCLGKKEFNSLYNPNELKRNVTIGNIFKLLLLIALVVVLYIYIFQEF